MNRIINTKYMARLSIDLERLHRGWFETFTSLPELTDDRIYGMPTLPPTEVAHFTATKILVFLL